MRTTLATKESSYYMASADIVNLGPAYIKHINNLPYDKHVLWRALLDPSARQGLSEALTREFDRQAEPGLIPLRAEEARIKAKLDNAEDCYRKQNTYLLSLEETIPNPQVELTREPWDWYSALLAAMLFGLVGLTLGISGYVISELLREETIILGADYTFWVALAIILGSTFSPKWLRSTLGTPRSRLVILRVFMVLSMVFCFFAIFVFMLKASGILATTPVVPLDWNSEALPDSLLTDDLLDLLRRVLQIIGETCFGAWCFAKVSFIAAAILGVGFAVLTARFDGALFWHWEV